jgi:predicted Zn-dependent protease
MNQEYYGHRDEMGAFAFNIACDMIAKFGYDPKAIRQYMDSTRPRRHKHSSYTKFLSAFDYDHDHIKVRQMKQKIMKQLEYAAIGRPFKTTNYLTY